MSTCTKVNESVKALEALLQDRYSCRAFQPTPVPRPDMERMFSLAQGTASWCNSQPWQVTVLSGAATVRLADALTENAKTGNRQADLDLPQEYRGVYLDRRRKAGFGLYESLGIRREDMERREAQHLENYRFFGAPHVAIITTDRSLGTYGAVDCGAYIANLLLAAQSLGIATVPQAAIAMSSNAVREELGIPHDRRIVCAVSFGYADQTHPANGFRTDRAGVADVVQWLDE